MSRLLKLLALLSAVFFLFSCGQTAPAGDTVNNTYVTNLYVTYTNIYNSTGAKPGVLVQFFYDQQTGGVDFVYFAYPLVEPDALITVSGTTSSYTEIGDGLIIQTFALSTPKPSGTIINYTVDIGGEVYQGNYTVAQVVTNVKINGRTINDGIVFESNDWALSWEPANITNMWFWESEGSDNKIQLTNPGTLYPNSTARGETVYFDLMSYGYYPASVNYSGTNFILKENLDYNYYSEILVVNPDDIVASIVWDGSISGEVPDIWADMYDNTGSLIGMQNGKNFLITDLVSINYFSIGTSYFQGIYPAPYNICMWYASNQRPAAVGTSATPDIGEPDNDDWTTTTNELMIGVPQNFSLTDKADIDVFRFVIP